MGKRKPVSSEQDQVEESQQNDEEDFAQKNQKAKKKPIAKKRQPASSPQPTKKAQTSKKKEPPAEAKQSKNNQDAKSKPKSNGKPKDQEKQDKKQDFLPGQKHPTPEDDDPLFAFYKSLYDKNQKSEMARKYCLEYGVLQAKQAEKLLKETVGRKK